MPATVDVYSAAKADGAAAAESKTLTAMGFKEGKTGGPPPTRPKTTTVAYGRGAKEAADRIAARYGVAATESATAGTGHVVVILGAGFTTPSAATTQAPADPAADLLMQGPKVEAEDNNGIPCVF